MKTFEKCLALGEIIYKHRKPTEDLLTLCERIFSIGGVWSSKNTLSYVKFTIYCVYYVSFLLLSYADLFEVMGNLDLIVMNIVETIVYTITFPVMLVIRFSSLLKVVIEVTKKNIEEYHFENNDEEIIYNTYHYMAKKFFQVSNISMIITVTLSYMRPLMNFASRSVQNNSTSLYILPVRIYTFKEISNTRDYILFYLYLSPIIYMSTCHMTAICVIVNLVLNVCADLSILAYRIRNICTISKVDVQQRIRFLIKMHYKTIWLGKSVNDTFNIVLLDELLGNIIVLAISLYYVLISFDSADIATCFTFVFFAFTALLMLYCFCVIGDQLTQECQNVLSAYYECNWQDMSQSTKKSLIICMIRAKKDLQLTGGKFYIFSLIGFTDVLKTTVAYLSLLRTVM